MELLIEWPQIIVIALIFMRVIEKSVKAAMFTTPSERIGACIGAVIHPIMWFSLLYWGGFFTAP